MTFSMCVGEARLPVSLISCLFSRDLSHRSWSYVYVLILETFHRATRLDWFPCTRKMAEPYVIISNCVRAPDAPDATRSPIPQ
jgi:hypothetical protein